MTLLKKGADVNHQNEKGKTALHIAAANGYPDMTRELLEGGADVTLGDCDECTALYRAAKSLAHCRQSRESGHIAVMWLLVEKGADLMTKDYLGRAVHYWARGNKLLTKFLLENGHDLKDKKIKEHMRWGNRAMYKDDISDKGGEDDGEGGGDDSYEESESVKESDDDS